MSDAVFDNIISLSGGDSDSVKLSAIQAANLEIIRLTAKGEESCSLAKDPGHPGANWV